MTLAPSRWGLVAFAVGCGIFAALGQGKMPPALPALRSQYGIDLVLGGLLVSCFSLAGALFGAFGGSIADRLGRPRTLALGLMILAIGGLGSAAAGNAALLLAARMVESLGFLAVIVSAPGIIAAATEGADRRIALGFWGSYMPAGIAIAMAAAPPILEHVGWPVLCLGLALGAGLLALATPAVARSAPQTRGAAPRSALAAVLRRPGPWMLGLCFGASSLQWFAVIGWLPTFMIERLGLAPYAAGLLTAATVFVNAFGNIAAGILLRRADWRWAVLAAAHLISGGTAVAMLVLAMPDGLRFGLALAFSFATGLIPASILGAVPLHAGEDSRIGAINGVVVQGANIGTVCGPPALALLVQVAGGWQASAWLLGAASAVGILAAAAIGRIERRL